MDKSIKKFTAASLLLAFTLGSNICFAAMTKESNKLYKSAQKFESQNRFKDAIDLMEKALGTSPDDITLNTKLAGLYAQVGEYDKALATYQKTLRLKPEDGFLYISIGNLLEQKNDKSNSEFKNSNSI